MALMSDVALTQAARERFIEFNGDPEIEDHPDLKNELENMITRNEFLASTVEALIQETQEQGDESQVRTQEEPEARPDDDTPRFTVGTLIDKE
jgi:hypothetical protein